MSNTAGEMNLKVFLSGFFYVGERMSTFRPSLKTGHIFYIPPKKPSDALLVDYLNGRGEFSVQADISFERRLERNEELREYLNRGSIEPVQV